jgi:hypothetical protein
MSPATIQYRRGQAVAQSTQRPGVAWPGYLPGKFLADSGRAFNEAAAGTLLERSRAGRYYDPFFGEGGIDPARRVATPVFAFTAARRESSCRSGSA